MSSRVIWGARNVYFKRKRNESNEPKSWLPGETKGGTGGLKNILVLVLSFPLRRLDRKSEPCEGETRLLMSPYTYLALGISNPVGAKLSRWRLRINFFGTNLDLRTEP